MERQWEDRPRVWTGWPANRGNECDIGAPAADAIQSPAARRDPARQRERRSAVDLEREPGPFFQHPRAVDPRHRAEPMPPALPCTCATRSHRGIPGRRAQSALLSLPHQEGILKMDGFKALDVTICVDAVTRDEVYALRRQTKAAAPRRQKYGNQRIEIDEARPSTPRPRPATGACSRCA